jgi:hypothetical protein
LQPRSSLITRPPVQGGVSHPSILEFGRSCSRDECPRAGYSRSRSACQHRRSVLRTVAAVGVRPPPQRDDAGPLSRRSGSPPDLPRCWAALARQRSGIGASKTPTKISSLGSSM